MLSCSGMFGANMESINFAELLCGVQGRNVMQAPDCYTMLSCLETPQTSLPASLKIDYGILLFLIWGQNSPGRLLHVKQSAHRPE